MNDWSDFIILMLGVFGWAYILHVTVNGWKRNKEDR